MPTHGHMYNSVGSLSNEDTPSLHSRRSSYGGVMSPEVEGGVKPPLEQDSFYMLKKDSQRRATLSAVLTKDRLTIINGWLEKIKTTSTVITANDAHLGELLQGLKDFIADQNRDSLESSIEYLKECGLPNSELHLVLYLFQEVVNTVLRDHSVKPHWMFAIDNLVRNAVQTAVSMLNAANPEKREGSAGLGQEGSPSVMSTVNSIKSSQTLSSCYPSGSKFHYRDQCNYCKADIEKIWQEMSEVEKMFKNTLQQLLDQQKSYFEIIRNFTDRQRTVNSDSGVFSCSESESSRTPQGLVPQISVTDSGVSNKLVEWLESLKVDQHSIDQFLYEEYCLEDVLQYISREDLRKLKLKGGVELRVWKAIVKWRQSNKPALPLDHRKPMKEPPILNNFQKRSVSNHN